METVRIHENNYDIVLYLDKDNFFGYKFNKDNTVEKIDERVFKFFDFLTCSDNFTVLPSEGEYNIVLDNETKFKHYFKGSSEDYLMFFLNNGKEVISYETKKPVKDLIKGLTYSFMVGTTTICLSLGAYQLIELHTNNISKVSSSNIIVDRSRIEISEQKEDDSEDKVDQLVSQAVSSDVTCEDLISLINNSSNLNQEEKEFLINEDLFKDALQTINENNITKFELLESLKDLDIVSYYEGYEGINGYYKAITPNVINIRNYDYSGLSTKTKDIISHEEIHVLQNHYLEYELLKEATAEIISNEYFEGSKTNSYTEQVYLTKKLMEIIGPDPVWYYSFTGDFSKIEEQVKPYLNKEQLTTFRYCLNYDYSSIDTNKKRNKDLDLVLDILYKNKYNVDVSQDLIIPHLRDESLRRVYFNKRLMTNENSYCDDSNNINIVTMTLNEAILNEYVTVEEEVKEFIDNDKIGDYLKTHDNKGLIRHCLYCEEFKETGAGFTSNGVLVSGKLGDKVIENALEKDLIEQGIIKDVEYYFINDSKKVSAMDYFKDNYNHKTRINFMPNLDKCHDVKKNSDGDIDVYLTTKIYLPTINERFEHNKVR